MDATPLAKTDVLVDMTMLAKTNEPVKWTLDRPNQATFGRISLHDTSLDSRTTKTTIDR